VPEPGGLGIHLTLDLAGQARFGPDVEWIDHIDYAVDPATIFPAPTYSASGLRAFVVRRTILLDN
jgi:L-2-hydroxyglutarate oxidase LhgO